MVAAERDAGIFVPGRSPGAGSPPMAGIFAAVPDIGPPAGVRERSRNPAEADGARDNGGSAGAWG